MGHQSIEGHLASLPQDQRARVVDAGVDQIHRLRKMEAESDAGKLQVQRALGGVSLEAVEQALHAKREAQVALPATAAGAPRLAATTNAHGTEVIEKIVSALLTVAMVIAGCIGFAVAVGVMGGLGILGALLLGIAFA